MSTLAESALGFSCAEIVAAIDNRKENKRTFFIQKIEKTHEENTFDVCHGFIKIDLFLILQEFWPV